MAITAISSVVVLFTVFAAAALTGTLDVRGQMSGSPEPPCTAWDMSMEETVSRMFVLMATDTSRLARCWTSGEADLAVLGTYLASGTPVSHWIENEHSRGRDGVLFAAVRVKANWSGSSPQGWDESELQIIVLRQHRDWSWTIDTIKPRNRGAMSDPHCGVCHR